jgi:hypothetical protein
MISEHSSEPLAYFDDVLHQPLSIPPSLRLLYTVRFSSGRHLNPRGNNYMSTWNMLERSVLNETILGTLPQLKACQAQYRGQSAYPHFTLYHHHPLLLFSPRTISPSLTIFSSISNMSQPSSSFQDLFNTALQEYQNQTGYKLTEHPLSMRLETCDSVDSIIAILQEQAQIFCEFRGDDGKLMKSVKRSVDVIYTLSISTVISEGIGLVRLKSFIRGICS